MADNEASFYSGTSGLVLPVKNKLAFPPEFQDKTRLTYYSTLFNSIEINSSFYKVPLARTVAKWVDEVTDGFKFTYKLWQGITHNKGFAFNADDVVRFMNAIEPAINKAGCLLIQFPGSCVNNPLQLHRLLQLISDAGKNQWQVAIEFRHNSWYCDDIYDVLDDYNATLVLHDMPASVTPLRVGNADQVYLRFHGPGGRYSGSYTDDFLYEYAQYINEWRTEDKTVYVYFNNTMGDAVRNLITLNSHCLK